MPSYKKHVIFSFIMILPFINSPITPFFAIIGSMLPDLDHVVKKKKTISIIIVGLLFLTLSYFYKKLIFISCSLLSLGLFFYFSKHRGISHSLFGTIFIPTLLTIFIFYVQNFFQHKIANILVLLFLVAIVFKLRFLPFFALYLFLFEKSCLNLTFMDIFLPLSIGYLSHIILDGFTPHGIKFLYPLSKKRFKKGLSIILLILWIVYSYKLLLTKFPAS
ncbi:membrane-bound metal-dependent hydrolase [Methanothermus fervidus DSM 2088]|uniref:Membrane-bound metal-dependent hydrolase n=1 Tax=Methanothermus fervidus (strain ATCC 43054 / DSM 2088 / JCM 10308 / V24 S) TaxID=523846 RepID=E3GWT2_METFV|nr:membrane-bound metal-dependent hydrolase [Methanothermus fervidus DSM 2088]